MQLHCVWIKEFSPGAAPGGIDYQQRQESVVIRRICVRNKTICSVPRSPSRLILVIRIWCYLALSPLHKSAAVPTEALAYNTPGTTTAHRGIGIVQLQHQ